MTPHDQSGGQQIAEHTYGTSDAGLGDIGMGEAPRADTRPINQVPPRLHLSALAAEVAERETARRRRRRWAFALPILAIAALAAARLTLGTP
jgi:hypothetical protein